MTRENVSVLSQIFVSTINCLGIGFLVLSTIYESALFLIIGALLVLMSFAGFHACFRLAEKMVLDDFKASLFEAIREVNKS